MRYTYDYPRPALCCDTVVFSGPSDARKVLLVKRAADPFLGSWALPGGFVDEGERPVEAARRELAEEAGVIWEGPMVPVGAFADPGRDPEGGPRARSTSQTSVLTNRSSCLAMMRRRHGGSSPTSCPPSWRSTTRRSSLQRSGD